jgi:hypothetical protein
VAGSGRGVYQYRRGNSQGGRRIGGEILDRPVRILAAPWHCKNTDGPN